MADPPFDPVLYERALRQIAETAAIPDGWRETLLIVAGELQRATERKTLAPNDLRELLTINVASLLESAIEAYDDVRSNGIARPQAIDLHRRYLRRAYRFGAAELLAKLIQKDVVLVDPREVAQLAELIRNRGTTDEGKRQ
jgi:hypothetical protein